MADAERRISGPMGWDTRETFGNRVAAVITLAALVLFATIGLLGLSTPAPLPASAPATEFSAERALTHLAHIAGKTHMLGSPENAEVRRYLLSELRTLGYEPQVQAELGIAQRDLIAAGYVNNIAARIPGSRPGKALMLVAHYDSVSTGPGAADDGASVAAILETLRALKTSPPLRNDLLVLFTDGEEPGLLGAEAFVAGNPLAADVGLALNFEYRGNRGPALLFETSAGNGKLIEAFAKVHHPVGTSLLYEVYKILPNLTDVSVFKRAGMPSMNFAAIGNAPSYHTQLDRPELLSPASVQHQGDIMLALARDLGNANLNDLRSGNRIYFDVMGMGLVTYSERLVWPLTGVLILLFGAIVLRGTRTGALRGGYITGAALLFPLVAVALGILFLVSWFVIRATHPQYRGLLDVYNSQWYWIAFTGFATGLFAWIQFRLQRWFRPLELSAGAAVTWLALLVAAASAAPGATYILTWPLFPILLAWIYLLSNAAGLTENGQRWVLLAAAAPAVALFAPFLYILFTALTTQLSGIVVLPLVLLVGLLWPLLALAKSRFVFPALPVIVGLGCFVTALLTSSVSAEHPHPVNLSYVHDGVSGTSQWISSDTVLDDWQKQIFDASAARREIPEWFGASSDRVWVTSAPRLPVAAPVIDVVDDQSNGKTRTVRLHISSQRGASAFTLYVLRTHVLNATIRGRPLASVPSAQWQLNAYGLPAEGDVIALTVPAGQPFTVVLFDYTYGFPAGANLPPRPASRIPHHSETSDTTRAVTTVAFK